MKIYFLLIPTLLVLWGCGKGANEPIPTEGPSESSDLVPDAHAADPVKTTNIEQLRISKLGFDAAKALAVAILNTAASHSQPPESTLFQNLGIELAKVNYDIPAPGEDLRQCVKDKAVLAFVMTNSPETIHICSRALQNTSKNKMAQILIHEISHVAGVHNECMATKIEVTAMRMSGKDLAFKNGYMQACGIH